jgi:hypothetical protein
MPRAQRLTGGVQRDVNDNNGYAEKKRQGSSHLVIVLTIGPV